MLHESAIRLLRDKPHFVLAIPFWLFRGKAFLKQKLASYFGADITFLPFNQNLIDWLQLEKDLEIARVAKDKSNSELIKAEQEFVDNFKTKFALIKQEKTLKKDDDLRNGMGTPQKQKYLYNQSNP